MNTPKVLVCQHGARRRYAVARILEEAGMLAALYTDSCAHSWLGRAARFLSPVANGPVHRLLQRRVSGIPREKVFTTDRPLLSDLNTSVLGRKESPLQAYQRRHRVLSLQMVCWGLRDADIVYVQNSEDYDFLDYAKNAGKIIVIDVNTSPLTHRFVAAAGQAHPAWGFEQRQLQSEAAELAFRRSAALADILLCPSGWVAEGVKRLVPAETSKIRICPYGSSIDYGPSRNTPVPGTTLFVAGDILRKGFPVFVHAVQCLKPKHPELHSRVAGDIDESVRRKPECRHLTFLGKLSWEQMKDEYLAADMLAFPTYSEGLAGVVVEAIAAGCPVITTKCAGIEITSMVDGILIPPGDPEALADAIETVYRDRALRDRLAAGAQILAKRYTQHAWQQRLVAILSTIGN